MTFWQGACRKHACQNLFFFFRLPFKEPIGELLQSCLLPHEMFASIWEFYPATFARSLLPSQARAKKFWQTVVGHPAVTAGLLERPDHQTHCVPLALHGDGVPLTGIGKAWCQTITNFSIYSLLGEGNTADLLIFIYALFDKMKKVGRDSSATAHRFFEILKWSFEALWHGRWPTHDVDGRKLLGQHVFQSAWVNV